MIAALFVHPGGPYYGLPGVDPWDEGRDARLYWGPWPVIAHPPCATWGRLVGSRTRPYIPESDSGCFRSALLSVRMYGGVIEHPEASKAFPHFGLPIPVFGRGWSAPDEYGGRSISVYQSEYGHKARKSTWLYAVNIDWSIPVIKTRSPVHYAIAPNARQRRLRLPLVSKIERHLTPLPFRDLLIRMAESCAQSYECRSSVPPEPSQSLASASQTHVQGPHQKP